MKKNFAIRLKELDGKPLKDEDGDKKALMMGTICARALLSNMPGDQPNGEEKVTRYELAKKVHTNKKVVELAADDIVLIKKLVGMAYGPLVVGQVWAALEA